MVTIAELGILRDVADDRRAGGRVTITPTYTGCPAMDDDPGRHPSRAGRRRACRTWRSSPCCARRGRPTGSSEPGRAKLAAAGIAPPGPAARRRPACPAATGRALPALRVDRHRAGQPLRLHRLQGAVALPGLPRTVRPREGDVMHDHPAGPPPADLPPAAGGRGRPAHRGRAGDHLRRCRRELRDDVRVPGRPAPDRAPTGADGAEVRRSYSICSTPAELAATGRLRIGVSEVPGGVFSRVRGQRKLRPGTRSRCCRRWATSPPTSHPDRARRYAALVAGSGITPVLSLVATALAIEPASRFTVFYGNRYARTRDVRRGAGRPEGPLAGPAARGARALPRAGRGRAALRPDRRRSAAPAAGGDLPSRWDQPGDRVVPVRAVPDGAWTRGRYSPSTG